MLTPQVYVYVGDFVCTQGGRSVEIEYSAAGKVTRVTSLNDEGRKLRVVPVAELHRYQAEAFQTYVDHYDQNPSGGTMDYTLEARSL